MNGEREKIFARIAEALTAVAPRVGHGDHAKTPSEHRVPAAGGVPVTAPFREWLPPVGASFEERHALFSRQSQTLKTELRDCADFAAAAAHVAALAEAEGWKTIALHPGELTDALAPLLPAGLAQLRCEAGYDKNALEACDAGLTECESLIAQTGSVCVTSRSSGGRALSVLPPHHVVIARRAQLLPDLTAAYEQLSAKYGAALPSFISFISGPSRTGDIERILVLGAHGPKWLTVLLLP